jgi:hypothetical protein
MANTGKQRSLTVTINKTIAGVLQDGYPHVHNGRLAFGTYAAIDTLQMATMPVTDYEARLAAFKTYVEGLEVGIEFDTDTVVGSEAYKINTISCPI